MLSYLPLDTYRTMETQTEVYVLRATASERYEFPSTKMWHFSSEAKARQFYSDFKREIKETLCSSTRERFRVTIQKLEINPSHHMDRADNYFKPLELENLELRNHYS